MSSKMSLKTISILIVMLLMFSSIASAGAKTNTDLLSKQNQNEWQNIIEQELPLVIELVEPYVERKSNGTFRFSKGVGLLSQELEISIEVLIHLQDSMNEVNKQILAGNLRSDNNLRVFPSNPSYEQELNNDSDFSIQSFTGINRVQNYWWGTRRYACYFESQRIAANLTSAASVATMAAIASNIWGWPITTFSGLAAGYYALLASRIVFHNVSGRGTIIDITWALVFSVRSQ